MHTIQRRLTYLYQTLTFLIGNQLENSMEHEMEIENAYRRQRRQTFEGN